jgi:hypothetical protein
VSYDRHVRIQESIYTILRASLLVLVQLPAPNRTRNTFLPADIREGMNGLLYPGFLALVDDELLQFVLIIL